MNSELLSTNEAAKALSVGASTVKRWADEGRLQCVKTAGGHRRFRRVDVAEVLSRGMDASDEISPAFVLGDRDGHATLGLMYQMRSVHGSWTAVAEQLAAFLRQVGEGWIAGTISIVEEHTISERLTRALSSICQAIPTSGDAPVCLFVMVEGDDHTLGLRLAELVAAESGWRSRWIGRNTPLASLSECLNDESTDAVAVSASGFSKDGDFLLEQARTLEAMCQAAEIPMAIGGDGAWPDVNPHAVRIRTLDGFRQFLRSSN